MLSLVALVGAVIAGLALAAIGSPGLATAVGASLLMGSMVAVVTFVVLGRIARARFDREQESTDRAEVVRTAIPGLDDTDGATGVSTMPWESRPDPFAVGWQEAQQDPATGREELRAWEDWTSTLSAESAAAPVWTDAPSGRSFDFKRWLPGPTDQDTVELAAVDAEGPMTTPDPEEEAAPVVPPVIDLRLPRSTTPFPDFAPWPDAPWRTTSSGTDRIDA